MKIIKITTGVTVALAIIAVCLIGAGFGRTTKEQGVVNMNGSWHQTPQDNTPVNMVADIENNQIQIKMVSNGTRLLYWDGTFDAYNRTGSFQVVSMPTEQGLSQSKSKTFYYKNGELSYDFTMLGKSYTVHLSRGE